MRVPPTTARTTGLPAEPDSLAAPAATRRVAGRGFRRGLLLWLALLLILVAVGVYASQWWTVGRFLQSTSDAYVKADVVAVAPRVSGYVSAVFVADNQSVKVGQKLVAIDAKNYASALAQQRATFDARRADVKVAIAKVRQQEATAEQARAKLAGSTLNARFAAQQVERYRRLAASGAETAERLAQMINSLDQARSAVLSDTAAVHAAEREADTLRAQIGQSQAQADSAQATVQQAGYDLGHTLVTASIAGQIGDRTVQVGQFVQPGTRLLSLVPIHDLYVVANFKETQTGQMRIGQDADISVDALGGRVLHATVESFAPATGAQFALLPPENATGNFTKIVQRVPVRLRFQADEQTLALLVPGLSVTVEVDTRGQGSHTADIPHGARGQSGR